MNTPFHLLQGNECAKNWMSRSRGHLSLWMSRISRRTYPQVNIWSHQLIWWNFYLQMNLHNTGQTFITDDGLFKQICLCRISKQISVRKIGYGYRSIVFVILSLMLILISWCSVRIHSQRKHREPWLVRNFHIPIHVNWRFSNLASECHVRKPLIS